MLQGKLGIAFINLYDLQLWGKWILTLRNLCFWVQWKQAHITQSQMKRLNPTEALPWVKVVLQQQNKKAELSLLGSLPQLWAAWGQGTGANVGWANVGWGLQKWWSCFSSFSCGYDKILWQNQFIGKGVYPGVGSSKVHMPTDHQGNQECYALRSVFSMGKM